MTRKDIEKAAGICSEHPFIEIERNGFIKGAEWRINSVWHKSNEEPAKVFHLLLIEYKSGELGLGYRFDAACVKRWAYAKDLLPTR